jgi:SAM-dependent methyltransferase
MGIRHRLLFAALEGIDNLSSDRLINGKRILHFAPEEIFAQRYQRKAAAYVTADFSRTGYDLMLDMSNMPQIANEEFDAVIALDVLEHVPDYQRALEEIHRVLSSGGFAILTVPQKDNLLETYEDPSIVTEEDRTEHFGQRDHLRIFGDDFPATLEGKGFDVSVVDESSFSEEIQKKYVLFPPAISKHPLATNHRKAFFCKKASRHSAYTQRHPLEED